MATRLGPFWEPLTPKIPSIRPGLLPLLQATMSLVWFSTVGGVIADWISGAGTFHVTVGDYFGQAN